MRIAYLCHWDLATGDGVSKKILTQSRLWRDEGHETVVFAVTPSAFAGEDVRTFVFDGGVGRIAQSIGAVRAVHRFRPDVVYLRYDVVLPPVWAAVRRHATVLEVNSQIGDAMRPHWRNASIRRYNRVNGEAILSGVRGVVAVSNEIARTIGTRRNVVIANGIDTSAVPELAAPANQRPRAFFLGSPRQPWHGVDKLLRLAGDLPQIDIDVVGYAADDRVLRGAGIPPNVRLHGYLGAEAYLPLAAKADFAVGSLGMHRAGLEEGAPLKVREYLALGLPVFLAYEDTDLARVEAPWLLRIPNTEDNVVTHRQAIAEFAERARGLRVDRTLATELIDAHLKERRRLEFMESLAA